MATANGVAWVGVVMMHEDGRALSVELDGAYGAISWKVAFPGEDGMAEVTLRGPLAPWVGPPAAPWFDREQVRHG